MKQSQYLPELDTKVVILLRQTEISLHFFYVKHRCSDKEVSKWPRIDNVIGFAAGQDARTYKNNRET
jgi:hypothetical protein